MIFHLTHNVLHVTFLSLGIEDLIIAVMVLVTLMYLITCTNCPIPLEKDIIKKKLSVNLTRW